MSKTKAKVSGKIRRWIPKKDESGIVLGWQQVEEVLEAEDSPEVPEDSPGWEDTAPQSN